MVPVLPLRGVYVKQEPGPRIKNFHILHRWNWASCIRTIANRFNNILIKIIINCNAWTIITTTGKSIANLIKFLRFVAKCCTMRLIMYLCHPYCMNISSTKHRNNFTQFWLIKSFPQIATFLGSFHGKIKFGNGKWFSYTPRSISKFCS